MAGPCKHCRAEVSMAVVYYLCHHTSIWVTRHDDAPFDSHPVSLNMWTTEYGKMTLWGEPDGAMVGKKHMFFRPQQRIVRETRKGRR